MPPTAAPQFPSLPNFDLETINNAISSLTQIRNRATSTTTTTTTTPAPLIPEPADIGARLGEVGLQVANNIFDPCEVQVSRYIYIHNIYIIYNIYILYTIRCRSAAPGGSCRG